MKHTVRIMSFLFVLQIFPIINLSLHTLQRSFLWQSCLVNGIFVSSFLLMERSSLFLCYVGMSSPSIHQGEMSIRLAFRHSCFKMCCCLQCSKHCDVLESEGGRQHQPKKLHRQPDQWAEVDPKERILEGMWLKLRIIKA